MIDSYVFWSTFTVGQEADAESFLQIYSSIKCTKIIMILVYCYTFLWENSSKKGMSQSLEMVFGNLFFTGPLYQKVLHTFKYKIWISIFNWEVLPQYKNAEKFIDLVHIAHKK